MKGNQLHQVCAHRIDLSLQKHNILYVAKNQVRKYSLTLSRKIRVKWTCLEIRELQRSSTASRYPGTHE